MNFSKMFSHIQESDWYREFLVPVVQQVEPNTNVLDIGTGTGKLLQILSIERNVKCIGVDTSSEMLGEAQKKIQQTDAKLQLIQPDTRLPYGSDTFDSVLICNVLFNLPLESRDFLLGEAIRLARPDGKIIILTPSGRGTFPGIVRKYFNTSIFLWYYATRSSARRWSSDQYLVKFAKARHLTYSHRRTFGDLAQLEILTKDIFFHIN